jgi:hypothetical protein
MLGDFLRTATLTISSVRCAFIFRHKKNVRLDKRWEYCGHSETLDLMNLKYIYVPHFLEYKYL